MKKMIVFLLALCCCSVFFACKKHCEHQYQEEITTAASCSNAGIKTFTCTLCNDSYTEDIDLVAHTYSDAVVTKAPTCAAEGTKTFTCSVCKNTKTESIAKTEHKYTSKVTAEPTCTAKGTKTFTCTGCGDNKSEIINAKGHNYKTDLVKKATCTDNGQNKISCTRCNYSYTEAINSTGHNWISATCTEAKHCTKCNLSEGKALGHTTQSGTCGRCKQVVVNTEKIAAIEAENKRHEGAIAQIEQYYDTSISILERTISSLKSQYGISYVSSESYYLNRQRSVESEISNTISKMYYTSSALEKAQLERQLTNLQEELLEINICLRIIEKQDELDSLRNQKTLLLRDENELHKENLEDIEKKYG